MSRPTGIFKKDNEYQKLISNGIYEKTPKAVFAAICVSLATNWANIPFEKIDEFIKEEWSVLEKNGIVPQKVIK